MASKRLQQVVPALLLVAAWYFTGYQYNSPGGLRFGAYALKVECEAARTKALKIHADPNHPTIAVLPLKTAERCELVRTAPAEAVFSMLN